MDEESHSLLPNQNEKRVFASPDPLVDSFLSMVFYVPFIIAYFIPLGMCAVGDCTAESNGSVSISSLIEDLPYATIIATLASISSAAMCVFQVQHSQGGCKHVIAVTAFVLVLVPLMLPLDETDISDDYHNGFAFTAFSLEMLYIFLVYIDVQFAPAEINMHPWTVPIVTLCFLLGLVAAVCGIAGIWLFAIGSMTSTFYVYFEIIVEYSVLTSLFILITAIRELNIYPLPTVYDGFWPASFQPALKDSRLHHRQY